MLSYAILSYPNPLTPHVEIAINFQLMEGNVIWVVFFGAPRNPNPFHKGIPGNPDHQPLLTTNLPSIETFEQENHLPSGKLT